jgi:CRISPR/Cas system CSM-associated protein Csm3 (group 7 of RAMP superfamily)
MSYARVRIKFEIEVKTALHIGDDSTAPFEHRHRENSILVHQLTKEEHKSLGEIKGSYRRCVSDHRGKPIIPGSTLRGWLKKASNNDANFGALTPEGHSAGSLRFSDVTMNSEQPPPVSLPFWCEKRRTYLQSHVSVDKITGAADEHKLFLTELIAPGTLFSGEVVWIPRNQRHSIEMADIEWIKHLLVTLDGGSNALVGAEQSAGHGSVRLKIEKVLGVSVDQRANLKMEWHDLRGECVAIAMAPNSIALSLCFDDPFLINDIAQRKPKPKNDGKKPKDKESNRRADPTQLTVLDSRGKPFVPAATLKGVFRARAEKILRSRLLTSGLSERHLDDACQELSGSLFGGERLRSLLLWTDAVLPERSNWEPHEQTMIAIDRFTGGVADGKLYAIKAARVESLVFSVSLDETRKCKFEDWHKGWLLWLARDAIDGDLALGWGKNRGFGAFMLRETGSNAKTPSQQLSDLKTKHAEASVWLEEFERKLAEVVRKFPKALSEAVQ